MTPDVPYIGIRTIEAIFSAGFVFAMLLGYLLNRWLHRKEPNHVEID